ncbi:MAG: hypothetical protein SFU83_11030 [Meiothermus sp.]|nr:hypothetical protein [Meiothermus sp.]
MRIGLLQTWLGSRYLPFWTAYLGELELTLMAPQPEAVRLPQPEPVRGVIEQVFSLKNQGVDYLLLPDVQLGVESRKGRPSPWMVDLEAMLRNLVPGLPPVLTVPAELSLEVAGLAAEVGQTLSRNPMLTRRALERTKKLLTPSYKAPVQPGSGLVALVAQPMLAESVAVRPLREALGARGLHLFLADKPPAEMRLEGLNLGLGLELPTDLEAAGMHRYGSRLGKVSALLYLHDGEYLPLPNPLRKLARHNAKPWRMAGLEADWATTVDELVAELAAR